MDFEQGLEILGSLREKATRWGFRHYNIAQDSEYRPETILEAIIAVSRGYEEQLEDAEEATKGKGGELRAAVAREGRAKKQIEKLKSEIDDLKVQVNTLITTSGGLERELKRTRIKYDEVADKLAITEKYVDLTE